MTHQINCVGCDESPGCILMQSSILVSKMFQEVTGLNGIFPNLFVYKNVTLKIVFYFLVTPSYKLCKSCQTELRSCYNFRKRCHEIFTLYNHKDTEPDPKQNYLIEETELLQEDFVNQYPIETVKCESEITFNSVDETFVSEEELIDDTIEESLEQDYNPDSSDEDINPSSIQEPNETIREQFQCSECEKTFTKRSHLTAHKSSHENLRQFKCAKESCNSAFNVAARLIRHLRNVHQADEEEIADVREQSKALKEKKPKATNDKVPKGKVQCEICKKVLSNARYLKEHMTLQHLKNSKYVCKEPGCRKRFKIWSLLERHIKKHRGDGE